jgi:hypothetical protein
VGDLPEPLQRYLEAPGEGIQDLGGGLAQPDAALRIDDRGVLDAVAAIALVLDLHRVGGIERGLRGVHRGGELLPQLLRFPQPLQDVALGSGRGLEELAVGAVSGAGLPVLLAASVVPGAGAGVERADRGLQAGDGGRVGAGLWVPKTCATWPDAPLIPGCSVPRCRPGRGMISGLRG